MLYWYMILNFSYTGIRQGQMTMQSSKLAGSPKSEASEIMLRTSETILALVWSD